MTHVSAERSFRNKSVLISGGTRGIGLAIATRLAREGARVTILGKTRDPHPKLPGTLDTACQAIEAAGGQALGIQCDIRDELQVRKAVSRAVEHFGGLDVLVNNASAIQLTGTLETEMKRYDLMNQVNSRGTFLCSQTCIPYLKGSENPHILTLSPPLDLNPNYFGPHLAYSLAKFGMSLCTLGLSHELGPRGIAVNSLWPRTVIDTAAVRNLLGGGSTARRSRTPKIVADAAAAILRKNARETTGRFFIDEDVLREEGVVDFSVYAVDPTQEPMVDLFLPGSESPTT